MEKNDDIKNSFYSYPKSLNHKVVWKKNDNIRTCDLNSDCSELEFNITLNKFTKQKMFNNNLIYDNNNANEETTKNMTNYDTIMFILIFILLVALNLKSRK